MKQADIDSFLKYYLKPGEILATKNPAIITTVLGSCICITMHNKLTKFSAICHAIMPSFDNSKHRADKSRQIFQYVDTSIEWMFDQFKRNGIKSCDIEVKIFGGAEMLLENTLGSNPFVVGKKNIEVAMSAIKKNRLKLKACNVGGNKGRKLIFNSFTGDVFAKFVTKNDPAITLIDYGSSS